jgi:hypothetical protein
MKDDLTAANRVVNTLIALNVALDELDFIPSVEEVPSVPVAKLSSTRTSSPSRTRRSTGFDPMKPAPPVTRTLLLPAAIRRGQRN